MNPVVLGLTAAFCWGISDWLARGLSQALGSFRAQLASQATGFAALSVAVVVSAAVNGVDAWAAASGRAWFFAVVYACLIGGAALAFFEAFGKGALAVVAPIVGGYGAVTVLWSLAFGAHLQPLVAAGLACVVAGAVLASIPSGNAGAQGAGERRGVVFAFVAAFLFGTAFFVLGREVAPHLGSLVPALLSRLIGPVLLLVLARAMGISAAPPPPQKRWASIASGVLAAVATVATGLGSTGSDAAVVAVLGSLSVVVTVLIGLVMLRSRLAPHQWVGVALALAGIPLLA